MCESTSLTTLDLSYNNFVGRVPSCPQFLIFDNISFAGNPNLCSPRQVSCAPTFSQPGSRFGSITCEVLLAGAHCGYCSVRHYSVMMPPRSQKQRCERKGGAGIVDCRKAISELKEVRCSLIPGTGRTRDGARV